MTDPAPDPKQLAHQKRELFKSEAKRIQVLRGKGEKSNRVASKLYGKKDLTHGK